MLGMTLRTHLAEPRIANRGDKLVNIRSILINVKAIFVIAFYVFPYNNLHKYKDFLTNR